jgi:hypothetical protein
MPVEQPEQDEAREDPLSLLGDVPEPDPAVVDAARERLWSTVAEEMLSPHRGEHPTDPVDRGRYEPRRRVRRQAPSRYRASDDLS